MASSSGLDKRAAEAIAKKLRAEIIPRKGHDIVRVKIGDVTVGSYGIRRSRKVDHPYIPQQIGVSQSDALRLASCSMSYDEYVTEIKKRGLL